MIMKVATVFSGIGAPEQALKRLNVPHEIVFACDIDKYCKATYFANYGNVKWYDDVKSINGNDYAGKVDLLVGGSPCQSFSVAGKQSGFQDDRGNLFFEFIRLINEIKPRYFVFENVPAFLNAKIDGKTGLEYLKETGYHINYKILNAKNFGVPQNRKRLFVVGCKDVKDMFIIPDGSDCKFKSLAEIMELPTEEKVGKYAVTRQDHWLLSSYYPEPKYCSNKVIRIGLYDGKDSQGYRIYSPKGIAVTLCSKGGGMGAKTGLYQTENGVRKLTPRECLRLMGFNDDFKIVVSDAQAYKQAGNSIVVDVLMQIFKQLTI